MTLNDLPIGCKFLLLRTGEKYIKGDWHYFKGKKTSRFNVSKVDKFNRVVKDGDLSLQCHVKPVIN